MDWGLVVWLFGWSLGGFATAFGAVYGTTGNVKAATVAGLSAAGTYLIGKLQESPLAAKYGRPSKGDGT